MALIPEKSVDFNNMEVECAQVTAATSITAPTITATTSLVLGSETIVAADLTLLNGVTATAAELNYNDITTLGTGAASKAVVLDAGEDYTWPATGILTYGVLKDSAATTITATGAEINYLDITTLGTGAASKAVVLDAGEDYTWPATGVLTYGVLKDPAATTIVATGAEINRKCDVSTRVVSITTTPITVDEATHEGKLVILNKADGATLTLPAATGSGGMYKFIVGTTVTSNAYIIQVADATDIMDGIVYTADDTATPVPGVWVTAADSDTITFDGSTKGGIIGDTIELIDIATNQWVVRGFVKQSGTEATPFSAAVV